MAEEFGACACMNLRMTTRLIAQFFDQRLQPIGLKNTQFTLLVVLRQHAPVSITKLAELLGMDRTTLTRNVRLLKNDGLIDEQPGNDARVRLLSLSQNGETAVTKATPYWREAQTEFLKRFGEGRWQALKLELTDINYVVS